MGADDRRRRSWRAYVFLDVIDGGCGSLALILAALSKSKIRCGATHTEADGLWSVRFILAGRGITPDDAAELVASKREEWHGV